MKLTLSILSGKWIVFVVGAVSLYAMAVLVYLFVETAKPSGARDFHPFWYAGHFILQGDDPYHAYLAGEQPRLPIHYIDGVTVNEYPLTQGNFSLIPSNTPVMLLLLSPLSYFSWEVAKFLFLVLNIVITFLTGWLVISRIPFAGVRLARLEEVLLFLLYFDFSATRIAIENGQTTLLVFLMMLVALLYAGRSWQVSGLALGIALSKYSLALPVFVFFLYKKNVGILFLATALQIAGVFGLAMISGNSSLLIIQENLKIFFEILGQPGIHLSHFFAQFTGNPFLAEVPGLLMTLLIFILFFRWLRRSVAVPASARDLLDFHFVTILFIWTLLIGYHRLYDTLILIVFPVLVFKGLAYPNLWDLHPRGQRTLLLFLAALSLFLIVPARLVDKAIPRYYGTVSDALTTILLLVMLAVSLFLLRRFLAAMPMKTISQGMESDDLRNNSHRDS